MSDCERQCYVIGGPWLAEDPDCPVHGTDAVRARREDRAQRDDLEVRIVREQTNAYDQLRREFNDAIARLRQGWTP